MKNIFICFITLLLFSACQKDPDMDELSSDFIVFTDYDKDVNFSSYTTYYIPDSVLIVGEGNQPRYWTENGSEGEATKIIAAVERNMHSRGYMKTSNKVNSDLGIQISYIKDVSYFYNYNDPYWWWGYPGYWGPGYWGPWDSWYYPYPIVYSYSVGSILVEIVDLKTVAPRTPNALPLVWTSYMTGLLSSSKDFNVQLAERAIDQAFAQSPYLKKTMNTNR